MTIWSEPATVAVPDELQEFVGGHPLVAETLARRGFTTVERARAFLDPEAYTPTPPDELPGMAQAVERVQRAVDQDEMICVWGDFDVDGQTATALLVSALRYLGATVNYHIPSRHTEGHGVNIDALEQVINDGARLILTCDTGIDAHDAVDYAQSRRVNVVITDHHNLPKTLPDATAILNPKLLPDDHPLRALPGVGVAYKLVEALYGDRPTDHFLDLVALGIVADIATQTGDTRYLLQRGLEVLRNTERIGLQTMIELAELNPADLAEQHISFGLAPRLNALGRLRDANPAVELLISDDLEEVRILANQLEGLNAERKLLSNQVYEGALAQIESDPTLLNYSALVLSHPEWHTGVIGIVASRLVEHYHRPAILIATPPGEMGRGSARSVDGVDITAAVAANGDLLLGYGGHTMAGGLQIEADNIPDFRRALSTTIRTLHSDRPLEQTLRIDATLPLADLSLELVDDIERLAPFGSGNPPLTLMTRGLRIKRQRFIGRREEHRRLVVEDEEGNARPVIWWRGAAESSPPGRFDLAYTVRASDFRGQRELLIEWVDAHPVAEAGEGETGAPTIETIDYRTESNPLPTLRQLRSQHPDLLIWAEASAHLEDGHSRYDLQSARTLVVWTTPPGPDEWQAALDQVAPTRVYLFGRDPGLDRVEPFLKRLAGLVKYALNHRDGFVSIPDLAAETAQREQTVRAGVEWLRARGQVSLIEQDEQVIRLAAGGEEDPHTLEKMTDQLQALLKETAAYRAYWHKMSTG